MFSSSSPSYLPRTQVCLQHVADPNFSVCNYASVTLQPLPLDIKSVDIIRKIAQQWRTMSPEEKRVHQSFTFLFFYLYYYFWHSSVVSHFWLRLIGPCSSLSMLAIPRGVFARQREVQDRPSAVPGPAQPCSSAATSPGEEAEVGQKEGHPQKKSMEGIRHPDTSTNTQPAVWSLAQINHLEWVPAFILPLNTSSWSACACKVYSHWESECD